MRLELQQVCTSRQGCVGLLFWIHSGCHAFQLVVISVRAEGKLLLKCMWYIQQKVPTIGQGDYRLPAID
jgi:hypothetical protein